MNYFLGNKYRLSFVIVFTITTILLLTSGYNEFVFDAKSYWGFDGTGLIVNGKFSYLNMGHYKRGVLFPTFNFFLIALCGKLHVDAVVIFKILSTLLYSYIYCIILPKLIEKIAQVEVKVYHILAFSTMLLFFWIHYLNYPLTDFICIDCILLFIYIFYNNRMNIPIGLLLGLILGFVVNTRPIYIIFLFGFLVLYIYKFRREIRTLLLGTLFTTIGILLISLPQLYINNGILKTNSIFVQTDRLWGENLFLAQLKWGVNVEKYETYMGHTYPKAKVRFLTPGADNIISQQEVASIHAVPDFVRLIFKYPGYFIKNYSKHLFNGMDIKYRMPYPSSMKTNDIYSIINYIVLFTGLSQLVYYFFDKSMRPRYALLGLVTLFILPALLAIPTAIEVRFFLPIYIVIYTFIAYKIDSIFLFIKGRLLLKPLFAIGVVLLLIGWVSTMKYLSAETYNAIEFHNDYLREASM